VSAGRDFFPKPPLPLVAPYLDIVRAFNSPPELKVYSRIAADRAGRCCGPQDRLNPPAKVETEGAQSA